MALQEAGQPVDLFNWLDNMMEEDGTGVDFLGGAPAPAVAAAIPANARELEEFSPEAVAAREAAAAAALVQPAAVATPPPPMPRAPQEQRASAGVSKKSLGAAGRADKGTRKEQVQRAYKKYRAKKRAERSQMEQDLTTLSEKVEELQAQLREKDALIEKMAAAQKQWSQPAQSAPQLAPQVTPVASSGDSLGNSEGDKHRIALLTHAHAAGTSGAVERCAEAVDTVDDQAVVIHSNYLMEVSSLQEKLKETLDHMKEVCGNREAFVPRLAMHPASVCPLRAKVLDQVNRCVSLLQSWALAAPDSADGKELLRACMAREKGKTGTWTGEMGLALIRQMQLESKQVAAILRLRDELCSRLDDIYDSRADLNAKMVETFSLPPPHRISSAGGNSMGGGSSSSVDSVQDHCDAHAARSSTDAARTSALLDKVKKSLRAEIHERVEFSVRALRVLEPSQAATIIVHAFPEMIDVMDFANTLSLLKKVATEGDVQMEGMLEQGALEGGVDKTAPDYLEQCKDEGVPISKLQWECKRWHALIHSLPATGNGTATA